jgi:hypothetical protein
LRRCNGMAQGQIYVDQVITVIRIVEARCQCPGGAGLQRRARLWPELTGGTTQPRIHRVSSSTCCLAILAVAYHLCRHRFRPLPSRLIFDWRCPQSHASLAAPAVVLGIAHKVAHVCISCIQYSSCQNLAWDHG